MNAAQATYQAVEETLRQRRKMQKGTQLFSAQSNLRTSSVSCASLAVAYWQRYGRVLAGELRNVTERNLLFFGQNSNPDDPPRPPEPEGFFARMGRWIDDGSSWVGSLTWNDITAAAGQARTAIGNFGDQFETSLTQTRDMLLNNPAAFARTVVEGYVNANTVVANTFTFGLIPSLDARAQQLMNDNSFYRVIQIGAIVGREIAIGALTGGVGSFAINGLVRALPTAVACRALSAQRLWTVYSTFNHVDSLTSNIDLAIRAGRSGNGWQAAEIIAQSAARLPGVIGGFREVGRLARGIAGGAQGIRNYLDNCFAAGTPIRGEFGDKAIEHYQPGDRVWSRSEFDPSASLELREIDKCFVTEGTIWHIHVGGNAIRTTESHPFWVANRGEWVSAKNLVPGDLLLGGDARTILVREAYSTNVREAVYNFSIAEHHTYFVGGEAWGFDVWAHNTCLVAEHRRMPTRTGYQRHHLNQDAAFGITRGGPIAYREGVCVSLDRTAHTIVHRELNVLWRPNRLHHTRPTVEEYNQALLRGLKRAGLSNDDIGACLRAARRQQRLLGFARTDRVPNVPGR